MADGKTNAHSDPRFTLHQRQPRANKLDARQRAICQVDHAYSEALRARVRHPKRFSAFMARASYYIDLEAPCPKCGAMKRRTRDRSCYTCHLNRGGSNFERMKAGIAPEVTRRMDGHLDILAREKRERAGEHLFRQFGDLSATIWPTGRVEIVFPNGQHEPDLVKRTPQEVHNAMERFPQLRDALVWAGWY